MYLQIVVFPLRLRRAETAAVDDQARITPLQKTPGHGPFVMRPNFHLGRDLLTKHYLLQYTEVTHTYLQLRQVSPIIVECHDRVLHQSQRAVLLRLCLKNLDCRAAPRAREQVHRLRWWRLFVCNRNQASLWLHG